MTQIPRGDSGAGHHDGAPSPMPGRNQETLQGMRKERVPQRDGPMPFPRASQDSRSQSSWPQADGLGFHIHADRARRGTVSSRSRTSFLEVLPQQVIRFSRRAAVESNWNMAALVATSRTKDCAPSATFFTEEGEADATNSILKQRIFNDSPGEADTARCSAKRSWEPFFELMTQYLRASFRTQSSHGHRPGNRRTGQ